MIFDEYLAQFRKNLMTMSRTANGTLDLSASATKVDSMLTTDSNKAQALALSGTEKALAFLYENRNREFASSEELSAFLLEAARITEPDKAKKYAEVLYCQALLIAGLPLENPTEYTDLVTSLWS